MNLKNNIFAQLKVKFKSQIINKVVLLNDIKIRIGKKEKYNLRGFR